MSMAMTSAMLVIGAYSANESAKSQNKALAGANESAERRYALQAGQAENMMVEQDQEALAMMTDTNRQFLQAKGRADAIQAETMITGKTADRLASNRRLKKTEAKGEIASKTKSNKIDIANGMLAKKVDSDAIIQSNLNKTRNVYSDTVIGGISGGLSGYSMGSSMKGGAGDNPENKIDYASVGTPIQEIYVPPSQ